MLENKFYKVSHEGGTFVTATFYNPVTNEVNSCCVRDYDYADGSRDNDELYYMEINEEARRAFLHSRGFILEGDTVRVIKGRTIEHGFVGTVRKICDFTDRYGRWVATYAYFVEGGKINVANCELVKGV